MQNQGRVLLSVRTTADYLRVGHQLWADDEAPKARLSRQGEPNNGPFRPPETAALHVLGTSQKQGAPSPLTLIAWREGP